MNRDSQSEPIDVQRLGEVMRDAFAPRTTASQAAANILQSLPASRPAHRPSLLRRGWNLAAGILLVIGLSGGFAAGRYHAAVPAAPPAAAIPVRIAALSGTVLVNHAGRTDWQELTPSSSLHLGDRLHATGASGLTLALWDDSTITLEANTTLSADAFNGKVEFALRSGTIQASLESRHPPFFLHTPQGTLEALGTEFTVSVD